MDPSRSSPDGSARRAVLAATVLGSSLGFLDGVIVNVALPALQSALGASAAVVQWVLNAYLLMLGALVLIGGAAGDRYGRRRLFIAGTALFAAASLACALAPDAAWLIGARGVQGLAAAVMTPNSLALLGAAYREDERPRAFGIWAGAGALTTAVGPVVGGWLVDTVGWRAIFLVNLPLAALALAIAWRKVPESRDPAARALDWTGALAAAISLGALTYGLTIAPTHGWSATTLSWVAGGLALFGAFLVVEHRCAAPMMPLAPFGSRAFTVLNGMTLLLYFAVSGVLYLLPFELIRVDGYSNTGAGAALVPFAAVMGVLASSAGKLARRIGDRVQLAAGPIVAAAGIAGLGFAPAGAPYVVARLPALVVLALGMSLVVGPLTAAVMNAVEQQHAGLASGINNAVARVAALLAVAIMTLVVAGSSGDADALAAADPAAFHRGFRVATLVAALCAAASGALVAVALRASRCAPKARDGTT